MARSTWLLAALFVSSMGLCAADYDDLEDSYWDAWLDWSSCSLTCGVGYRVRSHLCIQVDTGNTTDNCTGDSYEVATCKETDCAVDGGWGSWLAWFECSTTCDRGVRFRQRDCDNPVPAFSGNDCTGQNNDFESCRTTDCPVDGGWTNWGDLGTSCSQTCGIGSVKDRERNCTNPIPAFGGKDCVGNATTDIHPCDFVDCRDGTWEDWQPWEQCSQTCGASVQLRTRNCTYSASNGSCSGNYFDFRPCNISCPVDGVWSVWLGWNSCSSSCENGTQTRGRLCANPAPAHGGKNCTGDNNQQKSCFVSVLCPINGNWTSWQSWSACDATCGTSQRVRQRECTNPTPKYNGMDCAGNQTEFDMCNTDLCPVDGGWTSWFPWGSCSVTCGPGSQSRLRLCSNPKPVAGGTYCGGKYEEVRNCSINPDVTNCTIDGDWTSWSSWGGCSVTCGSGTNNRNRTCTNPAPHGNGQPCIGNSMENGNCATNIACPIDGGWSAWVDWFPCTVTCGNGTQNRVRTCTNPKPQNSGSFCIGDNVEDRECNTDSCSSGSVAVIG